MVNVVASIDVDVIGKYKNSFILVDLAYCRACYVSEDQIRKIEYNTIRIIFKKDKDITYLYIPYISVKSYQLLYDKERQIYTKLGDLLHFNT